MVSKNILDLEKRMITFDKVIIGFKVGKTFKRKEWGDEDFILDSNDHLVLLEVEDILADDWYEVMVQ